LDPSIAISAISGLSPSLITDHEIVELEAELAIVPSPFVRFGLGVAFVVAGVAYGFIGPHLDGVFAPTSFIIAFTAGLFGLFTTVVMEVRHQSTRS
jgi:hypothetical protein